jgi:hypothetical protein
VLHEAGALDAEAIAVLDAYARPAVTNIAGRVVGEIVAR